MSSYLYYCPNCNKLYKAGKVGKKLRCSQCSELALDMNISDEEYNALDSAQKQELKDKISTNTHADESEMQQEESPKITLTNRTSSFFDIDNTNLEPKAESMAVPQEDSTDEAYTMYYCKWCDQVFKADHKDPSCEYCKQKMISLHYGEKAWKEKTEEQKKELINEAKGVYVAKTSEPEAKVAGYSSVGGSLKSLSKVGLVLSLIGSVVIGLIVGSEIDEVLGFAMAIAAALLCAIMYLVAMGVGELCILFTSVNAKLDSIQELLKGI